jgi:hypothetical protein
MLVLQNWRPILLIGLALFLHENDKAASQTPEDKPVWHVPPSTALGGACPFDCSFADATLYRLQRMAMQNVAWVEVATSDGRCSSAFKAIPRAMRKVLDEGGAYDDRTFDRSKLRTAYADYYDHNNNQAAFCDFTREEFGPNAKNSFGALMIDIVASGGQK